MQRRRPDGNLLTWRIYAPSERTWQGPWPFLIQWDMPDALRLHIDTPGEHANGAIAWKGIAVAVHDLARAVDIYHNQLGLKLLKEDACSIQTAQRVTLGIGDATIDLLTPQGEGDLQQILATSGEGPYTLTFQVHDLMRTRQFFEGQKIAFTYENAGSGKIILDPGEALGVRLVFVA
jgi:catechol 2,3-dioxygenase-like lactoylglutathione lyase family enzyme